MQHKNAELKEVFLYLKKKIFWHYFFKKFKLSDKVSQLL